MFGAVAAGVPSFGDLAWKSPVRAVQVGAFPSQITTSQTISRSGVGALPAVDGVTLALGDRLLVADQTNGYVEGIYYVADLGSGSTPWILVRATDCDTADEMVVGATVYISEGTTWAGTTAVAGADWTPTSGDADWQPSPQLIVSMEILTTSGTWTRPSPVGTYRVIVLAGGGGGGGTLATAAGQNASGSGGGGGGVAIKTFQGSELAATEDYTVGAGGQGSVGSFGSDGGGSSFADGKAYVIDATGGIGGSAGSASAANVRTVGGIGGEGFAGDLNINGGDGMPGATIAGAYVPLGAGGSSYLSGQTAAANNATGIQAVGPGGGGSGATAGASLGARRGGHAADGRIIVESYYIGRGSW